MPALKGGLITRRPLCLSHDGKHFFAPCGNDVRVYSTVSGDHVASLRGHTAEVTAVSLDPSSSSQVRALASPGRPAAALGLEVPALPHGVRCSAATPQPPHPARSQVYSASHDGTLRLWDYHKGACLREYNMQEPVECLVSGRGGGAAQHAASPRRLWVHPTNPRRRCPAHTPGRLQARTSRACDPSSGALSCPQVVAAPLSLAYVALRNRQGGAGRVAACQLPSGDMLGGRLKMRSCPKLFISASGNLVASMERASLLLWRAGADLNAKPLNFSHTKAYTVRSGACKERQRTPPLPPLAPPALLSINAYHASHASAAAAASRPASPPTRAHPPPPCPRPSSNQPSANVARPPPPPPLAPPGRPAVCSRGPQGQRAGGGRRQRPHPAVAQPVGGAGGGARARLQHRALARPRRGLPGLQLGRHVPAVGRAGGRAGGWRAAASSPPAGRLQA